MWSDVSEWQCPVDDSYPYDVLAVRSNDGTYRDQHFPANTGWAYPALDSGRLHCLIVYLVYRQDWEADLATLKAEIGSPHPRTVFMLDVESWGGQISGDNSGLINNLYWGVAWWVGDPRRVIGYGNRGDLDTMWPTRPPGTRLVIAAYGTNPDYPGQLGHQFTDGATTDALVVPPFGRADVNSADGYDINAFCAAVGLGEQRKDRDMNQLPATTAPTDPDSDPKAWPERNFDVGFLPGTGWQGVFGVQEWGGRRKDGARGYLLLASWETPQGLVPVSSVFTIDGGGAVIYDHAPTVPLVAPPTATGLTLNYAAPGGAYVGT